MAALIVDLAEAIVEDLKAQDFGIVIPWERSYGDWDLPLNRVELRGDVVPVFESRVEMETRGSVLYELNIDIALRRRFESQKDIEDGRIYLSEIDTLVLVLEQMHEHFVTTSFGNSRWTASRTQEVQAWYVKRHLREHSQFTGIVRLPYEASRDI